MVILTLLALATIQAGADPDRPLSSSQSLDADPVVVTGKKAGTNPPVTGSRVRPEPDVVDFRGFVSQIRSSTGVGGMTPQSGLDPFEGGNRNVTVRTCKSSDPRIGRQAICTLARAQKALADRDFASALSAVERVLGDPATTPVDRFYAHRFAYQIAEAQSDETGLTEAIQGMVNSGALSVEDRTRARKSLAASFIRRGDAPRAIQTLEALVRESPGEAVAHANLAYLYDQAGNRDRARSSIRSAVGLFENAGKPVPEAWRNYLRQP